MANKPKTPWSYSDGPVKLIYCPLGHEPGFVRGYPEIVFSGRSFSDMGRTWAIITREFDRAAKGYGSMVLVSHCVEFTPERWEAVQDHIRRRREIENEYNQIEKILRKIK